MSTAIADTAAQIHDTLVRLDTAGKPLAIRHNGTIWVVDPNTESQHWYGRDAWWDTRRTAAVGNGDLVSIEYWSVQVRSGTHSSLRTATLRRNPLSTQWLLEHISDADEITKEE
jgi:hypothetical protein